MRSATQAERKKEVAGQSPQGFTVSKAPHEEREGEGEKEDPESALESEAR